MLNSAALFFVIAAIVAIVYVIRYAINRAIDKGVDAVRNARVEKKNGIDSNEPENLSDRYCK